MKTIPTIDIGGYSIEMTPASLEKLNLAIRDCELILTEWNGDEHQQKRSGKRVEFVAVTRFDAVRIDLPVQI